MQEREAMKKLQPYKPGKSIEEIQNEYHVKDIIKLGSNENPYGMSEKVKEVLEKRRTTTLYPDNYCTILRNKLANKFGILPSNLVFGNGSVEIIQMLCRAFLNKEDEMITCIPTFQSYLSESIMQDANIVEIPLRENRFDLEAIKEKVTAKTKIIFIANPNNPTGTIITKKEQQEFLETLPNHVLVVFDEAYFEFVTSEDYPDTISMLSKHKNICILRTFSKAYGLAALRIGYGIASEEIITQLEKVRVPFNVSTLAQEAAVAALEDETFMQKTVKENERVKQQIEQQLRKMKIEYIPSETNFVMINTKKDGNMVAKDLLKQGIIVRPGFMKMESYIRVSIGTEEQMKVVLAALRKII